MKQNNYEYSAGMRDTRTLVAIDRDEEIVYVKNGLVSWRAVHWHVNQVNW